MRNLPDLTANAQHDVERYQVDGWTVVVHVVIRLKIGPDLDELAIGIRRFGLKTTIIGMAGRDSA